MEKAQRNANLLLLLAAAIWGFSFVAQRVGMRHLGPLTFNGIRFGLGTLALMPLLIVTLRRRAAAAAAPPIPWRDALIVGGLIFIGSNVQQYGVMYTTAGKAGFITGLYVLFVPVLGLIWGVKTGRATWLGAVLAAVGLYLLSAKGVAGIGLGDGLVLISAVFWAMHVLMVGYTVRRMDAVLLAVIQFAVCTVLSLLGALIFESFVWESIKAAALPIFYAGVMSVAVAFSLQVYAQQKAEPAHTAILLSMESVFAALGGWLILSEGLSMRGLFGCGLMLTGILVAQVGPRKT